MSKLTIGQDGKPALTHQRQPNITCPHCKYRHPATVSCQMAALVARRNAEKRAAAQAADRRRDYQHALDQYNGACAALNKAAGFDVASMVIDLVSAWNHLGAINQEEP